MDNNQSTIRHETPKPQKKSRRLLFGVVYWFLAIGLLAVVIYFSLRLSSNPTGITQRVDIISATTEDETIAVNLVSSNLDTTSTPTPTPSLSPSSTPSSAPSLTSFPSSTSTPSPVPSHTSTSTPTPIPPTLTPARPSSDNEKYQLISWIPDRSDHMISLMESYPETLSLQERGDQDIDYYAAFYYSTIAQLEGLLSFPNESRAETWRWSLAYNYARLGDKRAASQYAFLISNELNSKEASIDGLANWFTKHEPRFTLDLIKLDAIDGVENNYLLRLLSDSGSATLWMLYSEGTYNIYPLSNDFNFSSPLTSAIIRSDLTGDGIPEVIITYPGYHRNELRIPKVFKLSHSSPESINFISSENINLGLEYLNTWEVIVNDVGNNLLRFSTTVFPACPTTISYSYQWTGDWLELASTFYGTQATPSLLSYCEYVVDHAASTWGPEAAIQLMEVLLPDWPPFYANGSQTFPADAHDEWRYRIGVYKSLIGDLTEAERYFEEIIDTPVTPNSHWITPAQEFLGGLTSPAGHYRVCVSSNYCDPRKALNLWVSSFAQEQIQDIMYLLGAGGVSIRSTDIFDFEGDGDPEQWIVLQNQEGFKLEFWIFVQTSSGIEAIFVDTIDIDQPTLTQYTPRYGLPIVWLGSQKSFSLERIPVSQEVNLIYHQPSYFYADFTNQILTDKILALFTGFNATIIRDELVDLLESDNFACLNDFDCAHYYYILAQANALAGDERSATDFFLEVWRKYSISPFTTMARLKLKLVGKPDPVTLTPSLTYTPTPTPTTTTTLTPTTTHTPTPSQSTTPTETFTPTVTQTFSESPTVTQTPTQNN